MSELMTEDRKTWPEDARNAQDAMDIASWDAVEAYRDTGEMVPGVDEKGNLCFRTVDETLRLRDDYETRKRASGEWRRQNLINQFKAAGVPLTPDVWERLAADRRQALEDDLAWIHP